MVERMPGFSHLHMRKISQEIYFYVVFFHIMATCSDTDDKFSSALVLRLNYTDEGYS